jgi:hypothetical protein
MFDHELLKVLGSRNGLDDDRFFAGRVSESLSCAGLGVTAKVVWVSGPRRGGKTAFAQHLSRQFLAQNRGAKVVSLDASGVTTCDGLLEIVLASARFGGSGAPRARFESFADGTRTGPPTLLILDEFDRVALALGVDEQGLLRRMTTEERKLSYIFVSHVTPSRIVEEVSDEASRLVGIAQPVAIPVLSLSDVRTLFDKVAQPLAVPELADLAHRAWQDVGGHALSVMTILQKLAIFAMQGEREFDIVFDSLRTELLHQMASLWWDLKPGTRSVLLDDSAMNDNGSRGDASQEGFVSRRKEIIRPRLLIEASRNLGHAGSGYPVALGAEASATIRLHDAIYELNVWAKSRTGKPWFASTDEVRRQVQTMRSVHGEAEFAAVVNHLHKVVYEAAREADPARAANADPQRWRIPEAYRNGFTGSVGIKCLQAYRSFFDHDADFNREDDAKFDRHQKVSKAFTLALNKARPERAEDWAKAQAHLIGGLADALEMLLDTYRRAMPAVASPSPRT